MPKFRTQPVDFLDRPRVARYGIAELRKLSNLTKTDPCRGQHWSGDVNVHNMSGVLAILLFADDPKITAEAIDEMVGPDNVRDVLNLCTLLVYEKTLVEIETLGGEKVDAPLSPTPSSEPSAESTSA